MLRILIFTFLSLFLVLGQIPGEAMGGRPNYKTEIREKFKEVNIADGVSKEEAIIIAQSHVIENGFELKDISILKPDAGKSGLVDGCWAVGFDASLKIKWKQGLKWYTVHIDKETGKIKAEGWGPS